MIDCTFNTASDKNCTALKVYEVHSIGLSMLFKKNFVVSQVMRAGTWFSQTVFAAFYPIVVTHGSLETFAFVPLLAANICSVRAHIHHHMCVILGLMFSVGLWASCVSQTHDLILAFLQSRL